MKNILSAFSAVVLLATTPVMAQPAAGQDRGEHRGDRDRGDRDDRGGPGWDRGGGDRGHDRGHRGHRDDDVGGAIVGGIIGGILGGSFNHNYRYRYDEDYYARRGYDRGYYDNWRRRDRGYGCQALGYGRGCRTIHYDGRFAILSLQGDVYCFSRGYRSWRQTYCPRDWYRY